MTDPTDPEAAMTATMTPTYRNLQEERRDAVTILTVHRPQVLNAIDRETLAELEAFAGAFGADPRQGALVLTGSGEKSFVSGADIQELASLDARGAEELSRLGQRVVGAFAASPKPVIAAINGFAFGGGFELALACHLRIASENAVMGLPETSLGIIPGYGGTQRLPRLIGQGRALEMILAGRHRTIKAEEAERLGIVNRVVPRERLLDEAVALAAKILENGPIAVAAALEAVETGLSMTLDQGLRFESALFGFMASTEDTREGLTAFLEKRPARFHRK